MENGKKRLYLIPVRDACNSNCTFCYMHEKKKDLSKPQLVDIGRLKRTLNSIRFDEVEITGGGEPLLHPRIGEIISILRNKKCYIKLYTNGFLLKEIPIVDEVNISRVHWDSDINNKFYKTFYQNKLDDVLKHYQRYSKKIRIQTILIKGAIDTRDKMLEFVNKYSEIVDVFMFRTLFPGCSLEKEKFVPYFDVKHPKIKLDTTLDSYDRALYFINTDCKLLDYFDYGEKAP